MYYVVAKKNIRKMCEIQCIAPLNENTRHVENIRFLKILFQPFKQRECREIHQSHSVIIIVSFQHQTRLTVMAA